MTQTLTSDPTFFALTPERILDSVELFAPRCTGRIMQLNSMENRVYEVEVEVDESTVTSPSDRFRVAKFYRPGRWTKAQIEEEHLFVADLRENEVPVVAPIQNADGETVLQMAGTDIFFCVFPKCGGRVPQELLLPDVATMGRLIARMHLVGAQRPAANRIRISPVTYGQSNLEFLLGCGLMPTEIVPYYEPLVNTICDTISPWFQDLSYHRIHGDCHLSNVIWRHDGPQLVDFDDMLMGPAVQDLWLVLPGRSEESRPILDKLLEGYEELRTFDYETLRLIEPLRALRLIHYCAWIGKRWDDPFFKAVFPEYGSMTYWKEQISMLNEQLALIQGGSGWL